MREFTKITKAISLALLTGAVSIPAMAFEEDTKSEVERIEVTGSRIARSELSQPTPIIVLEAKDIAKFGTPDLGHLNR